MADLKKGDNQNPKSTNDLLDKYNKVEEHIDKPKFIPYNNGIDSEGNPIDETSPLLDFMYYQKLPEVYRTFDVPLGKPLYRYLQSLINSGYALLANKYTYNELIDPEINNPNDSDKTHLGGIENLLDLVDPEKCPNKFLPYFCESMGIKWFPDLATAHKKGRENLNDYYNRTFLCNVGEIYKRRGTEAVVKYIAKVLTEMEVILKYERVFDKEIAGRTLARILWVELQAETEEQIDNVGISSNVIKRYIDTQLPYYITTAVLYVIKRKSATKRYNGNFVISTINKVIKCEDKRIKTSVSISSGRKYGSVNLKVVEKTLIPTIPKVQTQDLYTADNRPVRTSDGRQIKVFTMN